MEQFVGLFGRIIIVFHAANVTLAGEKRAPKTVEENDSLNEEAGWELALIS